MLKKTMMLAMAVAALAAIAVPSVATASIWQHNGGDLQENAQIQLTGQARFESGVGGIECQTTSKLTANAKSATGTVTQFDPDLDEAGSTVTSKCKGLGGLAFCQVHAAQALNLPWTVHNETAKVKITNDSIILAMTGGFCPYVTGTVTPANPALGHTVYATPNQTSKATTFVLSGSVLVHLYSTHHRHTTNEPNTTQTSTVSGSQTILAPGKHTYGTA